jgi:hypothetical protein
MAGVDHGAKFVLLKCRLRGLRGRNKRREQGGNIGEPVHERSGGCPERGFYIVQISRQKAAWISVRPSSRANFVLGIASSTRSAATLFFSVGVPALLTAVATCDADREPTRRCRFKMAGMDNSFAPLSD